MGMKETYLRNVEEKLRVWKEEVERLRSSLSIMDKQNKKNYERYIQKVINSLDLIIRTFHELSRTEEEEHWQRLTVRIEEEMIEFKTNLANALAKIKTNKI